MGVMYLFDSLQRVRAAIVDGVTQCIHNEADYTLDAAIPSKYNAEPGEYLGLLCVDDVWRLFCITDAEDEDNEGLCYIKATDAAVDDLQHIVVQDKYQEDVTAKAAAEALLAGTEWTLANVTTDDTINTTDAKWVSLWEALTTLATVFGANLRPYYIIEDGQIAGKRIDLLKDEPVYRGMLYESRINADDVRLIKRNRPITVLYGLGKATGTGDDAENLTIADVVWSKANGDPADKPAGQLWVEDVEASALYGRREQIFVAAEIEDANELQQATWDELQKQKKPAITVELTIMDAEQLHGGKWKAVRLGDIATVRTQKKQDVETRVVNIHRDYVTPELTKFVSGEQMPSATNQVRGLIRASIKTQETLTVYRNRFLHDEALIQLYADTILVHAEELLSLRAGVDESLAEIILANGRIEANAAAIGLKADQASLELANGRIDANAAAIALKADQASLELANGRIDAQANEISLKADKIDLQGYTTLTDFEALKGEVENLFTSDLIVYGGLSANSVTAGDGDFDNIGFGTIAGQSPDAWVTGIVDEAGYATQAWVKNSGYITNGALAGYATQIWVNAKGYVTQDWVSKQGYLVSSDYFDLQAWVNDKNYMPKSGLTTATTKVCTGTQYTTATTPPFFNANGTQVSGGITYVKSVTYNTTDLTYLVYA